MIRPTDGGNTIPADGIDIFLGPDMVKRLQDIWSSDQCNPPRAECFNRLANAMNEDQALEIEKRRIGSWYNQWGRYGARAGLFTALVSSYSWYWRMS